jgi:hypothetical protein
MLVIVEGVALSMSFSFSSAVAQEAQEGMVHFIVETVSDAMIWLCCNLKGKFKMN